MAGIFRSTQTYYGTAGDQKNRQPSSLIALATPGSALASDATIAKASGTTGDGSNNYGKYKQNKQNKELLETLKAARAKGMSKAELEAKREELIAAAKSRRQQKPEPVTKTGTESGESAMGVMDGRPVDCPIYVRGEIESKGPIVPRGLVAVLNTGTTPKIDTSHSGRLEMADWLTTKDNPLTARVMANRVWQHLFGEGIVRTADNFGATGAQPSHPELLDYLATRFMADGWSVKKLVRSVVLSHAYQISSTFDQKNYAADPDNALLWRANQRRLDAEAIRDAMLTASGQLDLKPATGSVIEKIGDAYVGKAIRPSSFTADSKKRSVYMPIVRDFVPDILGLFDFAEPSLVVANRDVTNVPSQALFMLNSPFVFAQSEQMARRLLNDKDVEDNRRINSAYLLALSRSPTEAEHARAEQFLSRITQEAQGKSAAKATETAWTTFCQALLACAEFRYVK